MRQQSTDKLRGLLATAMRSTAEHLTRLAWIVRVLEERKEELSDLRGGLLDYLRLIAHGQLLPELVVRFASARLVMSRIQLLPLPEQQKLADGQPVKLVVPDGQGSFTHRLVDPLHLSRDQVGLVFAGGRLRSESEQIALLEDRRDKPMATKAPPPRGKVRADRQRNGVVVNRTFVPVADVVQALADLKARGQGDVPEDVYGINVPMSEAEQRRLKHAAIEGNTTIGHLVRNALRATGLLGGGI